MKGGINRLPIGGQIDRSRRIRFSFNGDAMEGFPGDTLASALLANNVYLVARSFKYHRPRGIFTAGAEEPNALVQIGDGDNFYPVLPATTVEIFEGLCARSVNSWPSLKFDVAAIFDRVSGVLPVGFYYKTFMWPSGWWRGYERVIRRAAGLGRTPSDPDPDRYDTRFDHYDIAIIGGGPAGIAAALAASDTGLRVLLAEQRKCLGGRLSSYGASAVPRERLEWAMQSIDRLTQAPNVTIATHTMAFGIYDHNFLTLLERTANYDASDFRTGVPRQRLWKVRARQILVATGAIERPLVFVNNDLPGIMQAGAVQEYLGCYAVRPGNDAVVFTNNDDGYAVAYALSAAGANVVSIIDPRAKSIQMDKAVGAGFNVRAGCAVTAAYGKNRISRISLAQRERGGDHYLANRSELQCDLLCVSGGWDPAVHLFSQAKGPLRFDKSLHCFVPAAALPAVRCIGAAAGLFDFAECVHQAASVASSGLGQSERSCGMISFPRFDVLSRTPPIALWEVNPQQGSFRHKKFVDLANDVTAADIRLAAQEGYTSVEHTKRYTTAGMGVDQGKTGNVTAFGILGAATGKPVSQIGVTTFRPPYSPITIGALAGRDIGPLFQPIRNVPLHEWHRQKGAVFEPVGLWHRPHFYPRAGESMESAVMRECRSVREGVGICDSSTLGKIDIQGPDAIEFLNRVYTNEWSTLKVGYCRYGVMLRDDGMIFDDGITARLGEHHYLMTTTSANAEAVHCWLEEWLQCEWRSLRVHLTCVTGQWAAVMVAGPLSRDVLRETGTDVNLEKDVCGFMTVHQGTVAGIPACVLRVSFTGELSYEIYVPSGRALELWEKLMAAGSAHGITPIGTEALHTLRTEKGYMAVGHETDGTVNPFDLGMDWIVAKHKKDFIGKRSLRLGQHRSPGRKRLVGLLTHDKKTVLRSGSQIVQGSSRYEWAGRTPSIGYVTSSCMSATLGHSIALGLVADDGMAEEVPVTVISESGRAAARLTASCFYDPEGTRLNG